MFVARCRHGGGMDHASPRSRSVQPPHPALLRGPFHRSDGLAVETAGRLRGPAFRRVTRGGYDVAGALPDYGRRLRALRTVLPADAVLCGRSAAWVWGARLARPDARVEVCLPKHRRVRPRAELVVHCDALPEQDVCRTPLGPATTPARTAFDLARSLPDREAVRWVDALLRATGSSVTAVERVAERPGMHGVRGVRRARRLLPLVDPRAESPQESSLRWVLVTAGVPSPRPQFVVKDGDGGFVARLDLAWPLLLVGVEYDGAHHRHPHQHRRDLERHNRLRSCGWCVLQVDAAQLHDEQRLVSLVRLTLDRAGRGIGPTGQPLGGTRERTGVTPGGRRAGGR